MQKRTLQQRHTVTLYSMAQRDGIERAWSSNQSCKGSRAGVEDVGRFCLPGNDAAREELLSL